MMSSLIHAYHVRTLTSFPYNFASLYYSMLSRPFSLYVASSHVFAMTLMDWHLCIYSYGRIILAIAFCFSVLLQPIPGPRCVLRFRDARQHFSFFFSRVVNGRPVTAWAAFQNFLLRSKRRTEHESGLRTTAPASIIANRPSMENWVTLNVGASVY